MKRVRPRIRQVQDLMSLYPAPRSPRHPKLSQGTEDLERILSFRSEERPKELLGHRFLIRISSRKRTAWDIFIVVLGIYNCFALPFYMAFMPEAVDDPFVSVIELLVDIVFILDVVVNFFTTYISSSTSEEVFELKKIASNYFKSGYLFLDLLASIPFDMIALLFTDKARSLALLSALKLFRILRFNKIIMIMRASQSVKLGFRLFQLTSILILFTHLSACFWYILVIQHETWIPPVHFNYMSTDLYTASTAKKYFFCAYYAMFMLVGSEAAPRELEEYILASMLLLLGALVTAFLFGDMAVIVANLSKGDLRYNAIQFQIATAMKNMKLPSRLQLKIMGYLTSTYEIIQKQEKYLNFTKLLPPTYQIEINSYVYRNILSRNIVFFQNTAVIDFVVNRLQNKFYEPEKVVIQQFKFPKKFYFIVEGSCGVYTYMTKGTESSLRKIKKLEANSYFGEIGLLYNTRRTAYVYTLCYTTLAFLRRSYFEKLICNFPRVKKSLLKAIETYNDPWGQELHKMFYRVPYLTQATKEMSQYLTYTLSHEFFDTNQVIFRKEEPIDKAYFVFEGEYCLYFSLNSSSRSHFNLGGQNESLSCKRLLSNSVKESYIKLCKGGPGSVLCSNQVLYEQTSSVTCIALSPVKALVMDKNYLNHFIKKYPSLGGCINRFKQSHFSFDSVANVYLPTIKPIDIYKPKVRSRQLHKSILKFKNSVLKLLLRKRRRHTFGSMHLKCLLEKLKGINYAGELGFPELALKIAKGEISPETLRVINYLKPDELYDSVKIQFASKAQEMESAISSLENLFESSKQKLTIQQNRLNTLKESFSEVNSILGALENRICDIK